MTINQSRKLLFLINNEITSEIIENRSLVFTGNIVCYLYNINSKTKAFAYLFTVIKISFAVEVVIFLSKFDKISNLHSLN